MAEKLRHGLNYLWPSEIAEQYYCEYKVHLKRIHPEVRVDLPPLELGEVSVTVQPAGSNLGVGRPWRWAVSAAWR